MDRCQILESYIRSIRCYEILTKEEELALGKRKLKGCKDSLEKLVLSNLRLVIWIAKRYKSNMPFIDRIQEGNIGLFKAAQTWDYKKGFGFPVFACSGIRFALINAHDAQSKPVYLIPDKETLEHENWDENLDLSFLSSRIFKFIKKLPKNERFVVRKRFGFGRNRIHTLTQVGKLKGVCKQRIYAIESSAIRHLKIYGFVSEMKKFM